MPRRAPAPPLFPYTTLFRSQIAASVNQPAQILAYQARGGVGFGLSSFGISAAVGQREGDDQRAPGKSGFERSEEHTSELQSHSDIVCRLLRDKKTRTNT